MGFLDVLSGLGEGAEAGGRFYAWAKGQEADRADRAEDRRFRREALESSNRNAQLDRDLRLLIQELEQKHGISVLTKTQEFTADENEKGRAHQSGMQERGFGHDLTMQGNQHGFVSRENAADRSLRNNLAREDRMSREMDSAADRALSAWGSKGRQDLQTYEALERRDEGRRAIKPNEKMDIRLPPEMGEPPPGVIDPRGVLPVTPRTRGTLPVRPRGQTPPARTPDTVAEELTRAIAAANAAEGAERAKLLERVRQLRDELGGGGQ